MPSQLMFLGAKIGGMNQLYDNTLDFLWQLQWLPVPFGISPAPDADHRDVHTVLTVLVCCVTKTWQQESKHWESPITCYR